MGNRKQPFGYQMVMGEIVSHPAEAELVQHIFWQYRSGATFSTLTAELRDQPIPYDEGKLWNKNMVARILEDRRYTGAGGYPAIIQANDLEQVQRKRGAKKATVQQTAAQKILRQLSGQTVTKQMERQVLELLNKLIRAPEQIRLPEPTYTSQVAEWELQRELDEVMHCQPVNEEEARRLIRTIAAARYNAIGPSQYETIRLRRVLSRYQRMEELNAELLQSVVAAIECHGDGTLDIRLKNNQIIGRSTAV
ncbi:recombinase family protein [Candidatus Avoscillospira sp. LCP25S3_F1]|uniref:recombinase family protein n=1 Tax=Candidatus Avoscillospira sp. LCP25S3_F1 TaxID=3438825 RepID=UPI003F9343DC